MAASRLPGRLRRWGDIADLKGGGPAQQLARVQLVRPVRFLVVVKETGPGVGRVEWSAQIATDRAQLSTAVFRPPAVVLAQQLIVSGRALGLDCSVAAILVPLEDVEEEEGAANE